jgi:hypothetical protein
MLLCAAVLVAADSWYRFPHPPALSLRSEPLRIPARSLRNAGASSKISLGAQQRLALQFLAGSPFGATEAAMFVNGFKRQTLLRLIRAGLATTRRDIEAGGQTVGRMRITEAGRRALEGY